ncbi:MAG TPA: CHAT domain-containing protein [Herpetosiphonaceae bacterium]
MPDRIIAEKALRQIEAIIDALAAYHDQFPSNVRRSIEKLYAIMRDEYASARFDHQRGAALVFFLEALDTIGQVRDYVGSLIDATKGPPMRGTGEATDPALLDRLPSSIGPEHITRSKPPETTPPTPSPYPQPSRPITRGPIDVPPIPLPQPYPGPVPTPIPRDPIDWSFPSPQPGGEMSYGNAGPTRELETLPESSKSITPAELTRYPNMEYPGEVVIGERTSLMVSLLQEPIDPATLAVMVADTTPDKLPEVEVVVRARGFDLQGSNTKVLSVARDGDSEVRFVLIPRVAGPQTIRVDFYQNDRPIGEARCQTTIVAASTEPKPAPAPVPQPQPEPLEFASAEAAPPDIELRVETNQADERVLYFTLHSCSEAIDYHHADMGSVRLQGTPLEKMQTVYAELSKFAGPTPADPDDAAYQQRRLASLGRLLWDELFPNDLKAAYWNFRDKARVLLITSDEPWIPWEIVKPYRFDEQNERLDEPYLCEQFNVARWLSGPGMAEKMAIRRIRPVAPLEVNLPSVRAELQYLEQINSLRPELLPDVPYNDRNRVIDLFENGAFNVLHVAAHGSFDAQMPDNSAISLTGGVLRPSDIAARFGGKRPRPLVFINACHGARSDYSFTGLGGWADRLVRNAKIGAFIGASWEVNDQLALRFAEVFYTALLKDGKTIGESFRQARQTIRDAAPANSTWLAYVLYADPEARAVI